MVWQIDIQMFHVLLLLYRLLPPFFVPSTFNLLTRKSNMTSSIRITCQPTIVFVAGKDGQGKHIISVSKAKHEHGQGGKQCVNKVNRNKSEEKNMFKSINLKKNISVWINLKKFAYSNKGTVLLFFFWGEGLWGIPFHWLHILHGRHGLQLLFFSNIPGLMIPK